MVRSPPIVVYISLFMVGELAVCDNVVKNGTELPTTTVVNRVSTVVTPLWRDNRIMSNLTRGCGLAQTDNNTNYGDVTTTVKYNVTKRSAITSTTSKPKTPKTPKSPKPKPKNPKAKNTTTGPKPNKNMSSSGARKSFPSDNVKITTNNQFITTEGPTTVVFSDFKTNYPVNEWKLHGFYTDDYMLLINSHWFKFRPPKPTSHYVLGFLYTVIMMFGCFGNSLVIFMYTKLVYPV